MRFQLLRRQATSSIGTSVAILMIVAVAAGVFAVWPRLARTTSLSEVDHRIEQTPEAARALTARTIGSPLFTGATGDGFDTILQPVAASVSTAGAQLDAAAGPPEAAVAVAGPDRLLLFDATSPQPSDLYERAVQLRAVPSVVDHVRIVEGAHPDPVPTTSPGADVRPQVVLSVATANRIGVSVGDVLTLAVDVVAPSSGIETGREVELSGVFEAIDPEDNWWDHQSSALQPLVIEVPNQGLRATGAAFVDPTTVAWMLELGGPVSTSVWVPVDPGTTDPEVLLGELRDATARPVDLGRGRADPSQGLRLGSALIEELERAFEVQRGTAAVLTVVAAGPVGVTFALLLMVSRLAVRRRGATLALASARGAHPVQIRGVLALEGLVIGVPAAALGAAVAALLVPGPLVVGDLWLPLAAAVSPAIFLSVSALPSLRTLRTDLEPWSRSRWRWVAEVLSLGVTVVGVYLLLDRGLQQTTTAAGVDPLATAVPLLMPLAAAVVASRLFPVPMLAVRGLARRSRRLPAFLGSARAVREGGTALLPMVVLVVGASIAVFSSTMVTTVSAGVEESARATNGADVRMVGPPFTDEIAADVVATPGVVSASRVNTLGELPLYEGDALRPSVLVALDTQTLGGTQAGVTGALDLPDGMDQLAGGAVPVLVSSAPGLAGSDPLSTVVEGVEVPLVVVQESVRAPGVVDGGDFFVVDLELLREVTGQPLTPRTMLVDVADDADLGATVAALRTVIDRGSIDTADGTTASFLHSPSAAALQRGFVLTLVVSLVQSAMGVVLTLMLAAPARSRLLAILRTLGVTARQARTIVLWELVPVAAFALLIGAALGVALPDLVVATVDLTAFTGQAQPLVRRDRTLTAAVLAAAVLSVTLTLVVAGALARRRSLHVLRIGDPT